LGAVTEAVSEAVWVQDWLIPARINKMNE